MMKLDIEIVECDEKKFLNSFYCFGRKNYMTDSGFDIVIPRDMTIPANSIGFKIKLGIMCEPIFEDNKVRGYFLFPRSSTGSKTPLRMSNNTGIIDFTYRGELMACVDNISNNDFNIEQGHRLFQLCSPDLSPIEFSVKDKLSFTTRNTGGYGSTGS